MIGPITAVESVLYTAKALRNVGLVLLSLYVSGSYLVGVYSLAHILEFLHDDIAIALLAVLLGVVLIAENAARLISYSRSDPDTPRIAVGIILSFTALGFGVALVRIWLPTLLSAFKQLLMPLPGGL